MPAEETLATALRHRGISRRAFLKYCAALTSLLALPPAATGHLVEALGSARRPSMIWLSFQECTGCTESLTRAYAPTLERLMFEFLSLDYHHTLQAASGEAAEAARQDTMEQFRGAYLLAVDGAVPTRDQGACSTIAGSSNLAMLQACAADAGMILAIGTCAAFGGLPAAAPNPTGAMSVGELMQNGQIAQKPLVNLPGCPPLPAAISATVAHHITFARLPEVDDLRRPLAFYAHTIHDRCPRLQFFRQAQFARSFDDEGARQGWCLYELGCRGPVTHNACPTAKWNKGTSFPIEAGSPCIGCSEPGFWNRDGFYQPIAATRTAVEQERKKGSQADGRALFEEHCIYCHSTGNAPFKTDLEQIPDLMRSGRISAHRFEFDERQLEALADYLAEQKKTP